MPIRYGIQRTWYDYEIILLNIRVSPLNVKIGKKSLIKKQKLLRTKNKRTDSYRAKILKPTRRYYHP